VLFAVQLKMYLGQMEIQDTVYIRPIGPTIDTFDQQELSNESFAFVPFVYFESILILQPLSLSSRTYYSLRKRYCMAIWLMPSTVLH